MEGHDDSTGGGTHLAVVAGIFATCGSLLGKLAGGADASSLVSGRFESLRNINKLEIVILFSEEKNLIIKDIYNIYYILNIYFTTCL